jgi:GNAT superfamily N-acetyltransferase
MAPEAERGTRRQRIDPRLTRAGWGVMPFRPELPSSVYTTEAAVEEYETTHGPADCALCVYVTEAFRGKGIGASLMQRLCQVAVEHACSRVEWTTDKGNALGVPQNHEKISARAFGG